MIRNAVNIASFKKLQHIERKNTSLKFDIIVYVTVTAGKWLQGMNKENRVCYER